MSKRRERWHPPAYDPVRDVRAIQALTTYAMQAETPLEPGEETPLPSPQEVKRALDWIIIDACGTYDEGEVLADGRQQCGACSATAVTSPDEAQRLLAEARSLLTRTFDMDVAKVPIDLQLVGERELQRRAGEVAHPDLESIAERVRKVELGKAEKNVSKKRT